MSIASGSEVEGSEGAANKSYIKYSTSDGTSSSTASAEITKFVPANQSGKPKKSKSRHSRKSGRSLIATMAMRGC
jgi:hypothetical protein